MSQESKPREFNLEFSDFCYDDWDCKVTVDKGTDANVDPYEKIRVIEKSAFDEMRKEIERLNDECDEHSIAGIILEEKLATANALLEWILEEMKTCRKNWCGTKGCECYVCRTIEKIEQHREGK